MHAQSSTSTTIAYYEETGRTDQPDVWSRNYGAGTRGGETERTLAGMGIERASERAGGVPARRSEEESDGGGGGGGDALHPERERALHPAEDRGGVALAVEVVPPREPDDEQGTGAGHGGEEEETDIVVGDYMERGGGDDDDVFSSTCLTTVLFTLLSIIVWAVFLYGAAKLCVNYLVPLFRQQPPPSLPSPASHTYDADADMRCPCPCPSGS